MWNKCLAVVVVQKHGQYLLADSFMYLNESQRKAIFLIYSCLPTRRFANNY